MDVVSMRGSAIERDRFAAVLKDCAADRRRSRQGAAATGDDIKIAGLFERLAAELEVMDLSAFRAGRRAKVLHLDGARDVARRDALLAQVGILYWPLHAADLLTWMDEQAAGEDNSCGGGAEAPRSPATALSVVATGPRWSVRPQRDLLVSWLADVSGGIGIVAPMLSVWMVRNGLGQMRDRAFADAHASVPATVVSVEPAGGKGLAATSVVLSFSTKDGEPCRATWHSNLPPFTGVPGDIVPVVPYSPACATPLVPSAIGDPTQTFFVAVATMLVGIISLRLWAWLFRQTASMERARVLRSLRLSRSDLKSSRRPKLAK